MGINLAGKQGFIEVPLQRFGKHVFTIEHPAKQGKIALVVGLACLLLIGLFHLIASSGLALLLSILPGVIAMIALPVGLTMILRSRQKIHLYERGIVEQGPRQSRELAFDQLTDAFLDLTTEYGTYSMKFRLKHGHETIAFGYGASVAEQKTLEKIELVVQHIVERLPREVKLIGLHNVKQPENDHAPPRP